VLSDLKEGKVTLPLIFALEAQAHAAPHTAASDGNGQTHAKSEGRCLVEKVLEERDFRTVRAEQIAKLVRETGALERATNLAKEYVRRSKASLEVLPDTEYRRALLAVPDFILDREN
jgi:octaprenyl-diphosphate synthase